MGADGGESAEKSTESYDIQGVASGGSPKMAKNKLRNYWTVPKIR